MGEGGGHLLLTGVLRVFVEFSAELSAAWASEGWGSENSTGVEDSSIFSSPSLAEERLGQGGSGITLAL